MSPQAPSSSAKCKTCKKGIKINEGKTCSVCTGNYHYLCLGISSENFSKESKQAKTHWKCPDCKVSEKRGGDVSNMPVRQKSLLCAPVETGKMSDAAVDELKAYFDKGLKKATTTILSQVREQITFENKSIHKIIAEIRNSVTFVCTQNEDLSKELKEKSLLVDSLKAQNESLQSQISAVVIQCNIMEQQARNCNIEIQCVPEDKNENLLTTIKKLGQAVSRELADNEIVNFHRVPKLNQDSNRPRAIVAKFINLRVRDDILAAVKQFNKSHSSCKLHSGHLGVAGSKQPVYVGEHLSPANKKLHAAARAAVKAKQYEFIWIRNGKIFVRKNMTSKAIVVANEEAVKRL